MDIITRGSFGRTVLVVSHLKRTPCRISPGLILSRSYKVQRNAQNKSGYSKAIFYTSPHKGLLSETRYLNQNGSFHTLSRKPQLPLLSKSNSLYLTPSRGIGMLVRAVRSVLKLRYLLIGGAVGGTVSMNKAYEDWKKSLPDMEWVNQYLPETQRWNELRDSLIDIKDKVKDNYEKFELDPRLRTLSQSKLQNMKDWWNLKLENAIEAAKNDELHGRQPKLLSSIANLPILLEKYVEGLNSELVLHAAPFSWFDAEAEKHKQAQQRFEDKQSEIMSIQLKYQKELERLEKENTELRKQILMRGKTVETKKVKKSLIDMYSEVLDELSDYDSSYQTQDHLPRVVVVGDQSSGKTSVLEMVVQARIFPRGGGEMMTRAPVKVTLSEGPYHVANFKDSSREFDLTKESDLADLRREVEVRMKKSVSSGKTVSSDVISMSVKGPGLKRMVLVDLPGIISTQTVDMADDTRDAIRQMTETYMSNPNAIILCIQDGSVDAERSNVTDLVSKMDPQGKRTIFVLTKVDLAEKNLANPNRVKRILEGKLFPMKALGYYAVVTGKGKNDESIQAIRDYEEQFFRTSKLFKEGGIMSSQVTTRNLTFAVADCFWKMVRDTVEQQADAFKAQRFNLETEWKNNFPRIRELDRDELFEKARGEILDEIVNLSQVSPLRWEEMFVKKFWQKFKMHFFENIYIPAVQTGDPAKFRTTVDIKLKQLVEQQVLPQRAIESGWEGLQEEFNRFMKENLQSKNHDIIFDSLKEAVVAEAFQRHVWEDKAADVLRAIQQNTLEDRTMTNKHQWEAAVKFLEDTLQEYKTSTDERLHDMVGPGRTSQWLHWTRQTEEQKKRSAVKNELDKILLNYPVHPPSLSHDDLTTIRRNLLQSGLSIDNEFIRDTWHTVYRRHILNRSLARAYDCRKGFYLYCQGLDTDFDCNDVVVFWRIHQILKVTANALRQQVMNREARRLEKEVKEVLEDYSQDYEKKHKLLTGRRVVLAEELKRVRAVQEKLEEFIQALNMEK